MPLIVTASPSTLGFADVTAWVGAAIVAGGAALELAR